jgi:hypothetical protein
VKGEALERVGCRTRPRRVRALSSDTHVMSRSNYSDELDNWQLIKWRGMVASATRGKRGQQFFKELVAALDAMPEKGLTMNDLENKDGEVCALGCLGKARGLNLSHIDPEDPPQVAEAFNIAPCLAQEVVYENDEYPYSYRETPLQRWTRMREWAAKQIRKGNDTALSSDTQ